MELRDVSYLDFALQLALEATPDHFTLTRLEAVGNRRNRSHVIGVREQNQLLVNELGDADLSRIVVQVRSRLTTEIR